MKIELTKDIKIYTIEVVAEAISYSTDSPYINYLKNFTTADEVEEDLQRLNNQAATDRIMQNLKELDVIDDYNTINLTDGYPQNEYGKYSIEYYENDSIYPFKYKIKSIKRINTKSINCVDNIRKLDNKLVEALKEKTNNFRICDIKRKEGLPNYNNKSTKLVIDYNNDKWSYNIDNKSFEMEPLELANLFENKWKNNHYEINFNQFDDDEACLNFKIDECTKKQENLINYGHFDQIKYYNIPIAPETGNDLACKNWLLFILKNHIISKNEYLSQEDFEQERDNIFYNTPEFANFQNMELPTIEETLRLSNPKDNFYWLLKTSQDLYPFPKFNKTTNSIPESKNANLAKVFKDYFNTGSKLTIIDRYINTKRHFDSLIKLQEAFDLDITIFTTDIYDNKCSKKDKNSISKKIRKTNINRNILLKKQLPHDRYWKIDDNIYSLSKSIDFIQTFDNGINIKQIFIDKRNIKDIDSSAKKLLEQENE